MDEKQGKQEKQGLGKYQIRRRWTFGALVTMLVGMFAALHASRHADGSPRPVLRRLLPPLAVMVVLMTVGTGTLLWNQQRQQQIRETAAQTATVSREFKVDLDNQAAGLSMALQPIAADAKVQKALREGDAESLLSAWQPLFEKLQSTNNLTHFYFFDKNRVCLLRVHKPEKRGDLINRFTALEAERTGKTVSGVELGPLGTFTLRVVQPVFDGERLIGYVELGKEIEDILQLRRTAGIELAVTIRKAQLERQNWEEGMRLLGRKADWDRLPYSVVIYASQGHLSDAIAAIGDHDSTDRHAHGETDRDIAVDGKDWRVSAMPLQDAAETEVGDLLVMRDITAGNEAFVRLLAMGGMAGGVLLALLLGFIIALLRRADAGIRAQQATLKNALRFHQDLMDAVSAPIFYKDAACVYTGGNKAFERYMGLTSEQFIGKTVYDLAPPDLAEKYEKADRALLNSPGVQTYEASVVYADGTRHEVIFNKATFSDSEGRVAGLIGVILDISERKKTENALRDSEERLHLALSGASMAAWDWHIPSGALIFNARWAEILGYKLEELPARIESWETRVFQDDLPLIKEKLDLHFKGESPAFGSEYRLRHRDGHWLWVQDWGKVVERDDALHPVRVVGATLDITERKLVEAEVLRSNSELEQFSYAISHDMRQPLRMISSYLQLLEMRLDGRLEGEDREYFNFAIDGANRLDAMMIGLLECSRIGRKGEALSWTESRDLLDEALMFLQPAVAEAQAEVRIEGDWPRILVSPDEMLRLIQNLIGNALKFRIAGRTPEITVSSEIVDERWRLCVADNGIGILPEQIGRLFQVFQRLQSRAAYEGTGIGLALCRKIVEHHGGTIWVESTGEGQGSRFFVELPKSQPSALSAITAPDSLENKPG